MLRRSNNRINVIRYEDGYDSLLKSCRDIASTGVSVHVTVGRDGSFRYHKDIMKKVIVPKVLKDYDIVVEEDIVIVACGKWSDEQEDTIEALVETIQECLLICETFADELEKI